MRPSHVVPTLRTVVLFRRSLSLHRILATNSNASPSTDRTLGPEIESTIEQPISRVDGGRHASTSGRDAEISAPQFHATVSAEEIDKPLEPGLYLVGTPIGNLEDVTFRALRVLRSADVILAEDTRHSRKLLNHYHIDTRLSSYHQHNERGKLEQVNSCSLPQLYFIGTESQSWCD